MTSDNPIFICRILRNVRPRFHRI